MLPFPIISQLTIQPPPPVSQEFYSTPGSYSFVIPSGISKISVCCVGGGSRAGNYYQSGTGLYMLIPGYAGYTRYVNDISVQAGDVLSIYVGRGFPASTSWINSDYSFSYAYAGDNSYVIKNGSYICRAAGGGQSASNNIGTGGAVSNNATTSGTSSPSGTFYKVGQSTASYSGTAAANTAYYGGYGVYPNQLGSYPNTSINGVYGSGGGARIQSNTVTIGSGGNGFVRIMYGGDRSYPNNFGDL